MIYYLFIIITVPCVKLTQYSYEYIVHEYSYQICAIDRSLTCDLWIQATQQKAIKDQAIRDADVTAAQTTRVPVSKFQIYIYLIYYNLGSSIYDIYFTTYINMSAGKNHSTYPVGTKIIIKVYTSEPKLIQHLLGFRGPAE